MSIQQLYICEKPSQAKDIARNLNCHQRGEGYLSNDTIAVTWCFGHLLETAKPEAYCDNIKPWRMEILPVIPDTWKLEVKDSCKKQFAAIKKLLKDARSVVIATDADREGEVIAREVLDYCHYKGSVKRLWLSALDDASIQKALGDIRDGATTESLYQAGLGRQRADWLIGMNITMAASVLFGKYGEGVLSVGRVQTPTLKLVVDRDQAIDHFVPKDYFELTAEFKTDEQKSFWAKWQPPESSVDAEGRCIKLIELQTFAAKVRGKSGNVEKFDNTQKKQSAPLCLSLSQLQKIASSRFSLSAQKTLDIAQALYETHKATSYPRTDCGYLPQNQFGEAPKILANLQKIHPQLSDLINSCDTNFKTPTWNDKKVTAHHGIIPTLNANVNRSKMNDQEVQIYDLICDYYLAQFLGDYEYAERKVSVRCLGELFKAGSHTPLKPGWKRALRNVDEADIKSKNEEEELGVIPLLAPNQAVQHCNEKVLTKQTRPPSRFTEGSLIDAMKNIGRHLAEASSSVKKTLKETAGIGTEATRAAVLELLFKRKYVVKKGKQLIATEKGKALISALPAPLSDPVMTAEWEQALDDVAQNQAKLTTFMQRQSEFLTMQLNWLKALPNPKNSHQTRVPINDHAAAPGKSGVTVNAQAPANPNQVYHCTQCTQPLVRRKNVAKGNHFWGCSGYPACKKTYFDNQGVPNLQS